MSIFASIFAYAILLSYAALFGGKYPNTNYTTPPKLNNHHQDFNFRMKSE